VTEPVYVLGHSPAELDRLRLQGAFFEEITRQAFATAGLQRGWRVLDIGCGAGDASLVAADMVGDGGSVTGIDRSAEAVAMARARARIEARTNADFRVVDIEGFDDDRGFDAVVGRFVLMHQADAASTLRAAARHVRGNGVVVMIESAFSACVAGFHSFPHSPTYDRMVGLMTRTIRAAGADTRMGLRLREVFAAAGLPAPTIRLQARVEGGLDATIYRYMADSLRSVLPFARTVRLSDWNSVHIDELEAQLRAEVVACNGTLVSPPIVTASCVA
jgi:SAM-dependent methyltransferase